MSPAKTIETMADHLTELVGTCPNLATDPVVFSLVNDIAVKLSGFRLLKLTDSAGRTVGFTSDKRPVSEILPVDDNRLADGEGRLLLRDPLERYFPEVDLAEEQ